LNPEPLIPQVYAYVAYRIGAGPDAEDVTSETFERALRYRSSYGAKKGPRSPGCSGSRGAVPTTRWRRDGRRTPTSRTFGAATI
jgi:DNA-directed RNA polymerase specialized sigma24 family protein